MNPDGTNAAPPAILHLDLDAFFASVEQLDDPSLRGRPVVVGGLGPRGVVAAASYEARRFGIFSATPMARARRACPDAVFLAPRFDAYSAMSDRVMEIARSVTPLVEPISVDEAFLDVRGAARLLGTGPEIAAALRERILLEIGLTASIGVATTKMLAKIASDEAKPDGLLVVPVGGELEFLHPLPIGRLWGVGPATKRRLERFGVTTIGDLAALPESTLVHSLGVAHGQHLHALAWNRDARAVETRRRVKSIGHEETFSTDVKDRETLRREVRSLSERVGERLRRSGQAARTVQLKVRYHDFQTITRSRTLAEATDISADLTQTALVLLDGLEVGDGVRLVGVSAQQLEGADAIQRSLFSDDGEPTPDARDLQGKLERSVDAVRERFGPDAVLAARPTPKWPR